MAVKYKMGDIVIRNIEPEVLKVLTEKAKIQGLNREEYLRRKLKEITILDVQNEQIERYRNLLDYVTNVLERNTEVMLRMERKLDEK